MKWWIGVIGAAVGGLWVACSKDVAGSTFETENSVAIVVTKSDGTPAAHSLLNIRPQNYLKRNGSKPNTIETDSLGVFRLDSLEAGDYTVEAQSESAGSLQKGIQKFSIPEVFPDSGFEISVSTDTPTKISGTFQTEKSPVWILIPGTDYAVPVDSSGHFEFPSLPKGNLEWVAIYAAEARDVELAAGIFETSADEEISLSDTATRAFLFEDFENGIGNWYRSQSKYATSTIELDSVESRGKSAHFTCQNDSIANWALMGRYLGGAFDMGEMDSVVFRAKGNLKGKLSFSFDVIADSSVTYESGKSWEHFELDSVWTRYVITPETLLKADSIGGNIGWDAVKSHVTNISIFGGSGGEFWIDDIVFYGVDFEP